MRIQIAKDNNKFGLCSNSPVNVKETGNITEIKYMTNNNGGIIRRLDKDHYYDIRTGEVKSYKHTSNRKENKDSITRTMKNLRDIINTNIYCNDKLYKNVLWITLTYKENMTDTKKLYNDFKKFKVKFKRFLSNKKTSSFEYITTAEPQNRGAWHLHILFIFENKAPYIKKKQLEEMWGHGFVSINILKNVDNVGAYLTAYLTNLDVSELSNDKTHKSIVKGARLNLYPTGFRIYRCSRGIKHPTKYKSTEGEMQDKMKNSHLIYEKTIVIRNDDGRIINRINYRNYNNIKNLNKDISYKRK